MSPARVTLSEPVEVAKFWKNRRHDAIVVSLSTYEGKNLIDVRMHAMKQGRLVPTPKGLAMVVRRLPDLAKAVAKALAKAQELGLLDAAAVESESGE
jgi:transcriptional coactivator p15 (PC4)